MNKHRSNIRIFTDNHKKKAFVLKLVDILKGYILLALLLFKTIVFAEKQLYNSR